MEACLDLAWSHWGGLGVRGTVQPPNTAVDPEALLYFTACLVERDPRLRDEVADWWRRYAHFISRPRLTALRSRFGESVGVKLDALLKEVEKPKRTSGKSHLDDLNTPARSLLRFRCVFGANARAEILLELLTRPGTSHGLTALALSEIGYSKRNIALVLEELEMGRVVTSTKEGNRARFRLADPAGLERVLTPLPHNTGAWHLRLPILASFLDLGERLDHRDAVVQGIEARRCLERIGPLAIAAGIPAITGTAAAETFWPAVQDWLIESVVPDRGDSGHSVPGMLEGVWFPAGEQPRRPGRFSSAVLPRLSSRPADATSIQCLDLVQAATVVPRGEWAWVVASVAATKTYAHTIGLDNHEPWRFATWDFGEPQVFDVEYDEPLPHGRIARLYGKEAAGRARDDQPAIQLRLRRVAA